jgi:hypothetical protein
MAQRSGADALQRTAIARAYDGTLPGLQPNISENIHHFFAIERKRSHSAYIGTATICVNGQSANIGILIRRSSAQSQGYGTEAWSGLMYFAFERLRVRTVEAGALALNKPMMRVFREDRNAPPESALPRGRDTASMWSRLQ